LRLLVAAEVAVIYPHARKVGVCFSGWADCGSDIVYIRGAWLGINAAPLQVFRRATPCYSFLLQPVESINHNERAIAKVIEDRCCQGDCTYPAVLPEVIENIDFLLSPKDTLFLVRYTKERCPPTEK
jgi:hypothetical protein